jgi:hypothetical protein
MSMFAMYLSSHFPFLSDPHTIKTKKDWEWDPGYSCSLLISIFLLFLLIKHMVLGKEGGGSIPMNIFSLLYVCFGSC